MCLCFLSHKNGNHDAFFTELQDPSPDRAPSKTQLSTLLTHWVHQPSSPWPLLASCAASYSHVPLRSPATLNCLLLLGCCMSSLLHAFTDTVPLPGAHSRHLTCLVPFPFHPQLKSHFLLEAFLDSAHTHVPNTHTQMQTNKHTHTCKYTQNTQMNTHTSHAHTLFKEPSLWSCRPLTAAFPTGLRAE